MFFSLTEVPATIRPKSQFVAAATMPRGENAKASKVTEIELLLEIDLDNNSIADVEWMFPGAKQFCQQVASLEHCKGEVRVTRTKVPEMTVKVAYKNDEIFSQPNCPVKKPPQLKVDMKGEAKLILKPRVKATSRELAQLANLIDADIRISMAPSQTDISENTELLTPADMGKREVVNLGAAA